MSTTLCLNDLFKIVWRNHWNTDRYIRSGHAKEVRRLYDREIAPCFGLRKVSSLKPAVIARWHRAFNSPISANRALEVLSRLYSFGITNGLVEFNPCHAVKALPERKRAKFASPVALSKLGQCLRSHAETSPIETAFIFTLIYTGSRPRALERAKWSHLTRAPEGHGILTLEGKGSADSGELETVHIPSECMRLFGSFPIDSGLIFKTNTIRIRQLWAKVRIEAECPDLWLRDLRRTFATVGMSNGVKMDTIGELLNHKSIQTTKIYAKLNDVARVKAVSEIANYISNILKGEVA